MFENRLIEPTSVDMPAWDDGDAVIDSLLSARRFQLRTDRLGAVRALCREGDLVREVALADVIAEARGSAARLRSQARDRALAALASGLRRALSDAVAPDVRELARRLFAPRAGSGPTARPVPRRTAADAAPRRA